MSAFPDTDTRDAEILAARRVPRKPWWNDQTWVRFSLHCGHTYRHHPADATSLQLSIGKAGFERPNGRTAGPGTMRG